MRTPETLLATGRVAPPCKQLLTAELNVSSESERAKYEFRLIPTTRDIRVREIMVFPSGPGKLWGQKDSGRFAPLPDESDPSAEEVHGAGTDHSAATIPKEPEFPGHRPVVATYVGRRVQDEEAWLRAYKVEDVP